MGASSEASSPFWELCVVIFGLSPSSLNHPAGWMEAAQSPMPMKKNTFIHSVNISQHQLCANAKGKNQSWGERKQM